MGLLSLSTRAGHHVVAEAPRLCAALVPTLSPYLHHPYLHPPPSGGPLQSARPLAARAVGSSSEHSGQRRVRGGGVNRASGAGRLTCRSRGRVGASLRVIIADASESAEATSQTDGAANADRSSRPSLPYPPRWRGLPRLPGAPDPFRGHHLPYTAPPLPYYHPRAPTSTSPVSDCTVPCHVMVHPEYAYSSALLWADLP